MVDSSSLRFLTAAALAAGRKEEELKEKAEKAKKGNKLGKQEEAEFHWMSSEEEEEEEEEEGTQNFFLKFLWCADTAMWADVPVLMLVLFQHCKSFASTDSDFLLCHRDRYAQCKLCSMRRGSSGAVLSLGACCCATTAAMVSRSFLPTLPRR